MRRGDGKDGGTHGHEAPYLDLPSADAYMRSRWEGGGDVRGVTLLGWVEEEEEERWNREGAVRSLRHRATFIQYTAVLKV